CGAAPVVIAKAQQSHRSLTCEIVITGSPMTETLASLPTKHHFAFSARCRLIALWRQLQRPWFAYLTIFLLQQKAIWDWWIWPYLTTGDTSNYFCAAYNWFDSFRVNIVWSPLYTAFYGCFLFLTPDVYLATVLHRLFVVLSASLLVLALLRGL